MRGKELEVRVGDSVSLHICVGVGYGVELGFRLKFGLRLGRGC